MMIECFRRRWIAGVMLGVALSAVIPPAAGAATESDVIIVRVSGEAPGQTFESTERAIANARLEAVLQVLESAVQMQDMALTRPILEQADRYVAGTEVLRRERRSGMTRVDIEAVILEHRLKFDLARLLSPAIPDSIRVGIFIAESLDGRPARVTADGAAVTNLAEALEEQGLMVIALEDVLAHYAAESLTERVDGPPDELARLARENLCDVIIAGTAVVGVEPVPGANVLRAEARLTLRAVSTHDAKIIGAFSKVSAVYSGAVETGASQAVDDAATKLQERIFVATAMACLRAEPEHGVVLTIEGFASEAQFNELVQRIAERHGDAAVRPLQFAPSRSRLRVSYDGRMSDFVDMVTVRPYSAFTLEVTQAINRDVRMRAISRTGPTALD